ncbi:hypothetical protein CF065_01090 [Clostridium sporogenes]|uniref:hypothetical protein n=2 Tax=Clostridium TaxID=1485 RepID=UPI003DA40386
MKKFNLFIMSNALVAPIMYFTVLFPISLYFNTVRIIPISFLIHMLIFCTGSIYFIKKHKKDFILLCRIVLPMEGYVQYGQ